MKILFLAFLLSCFVHFTASAQPKCSVVKYSTENGLLDNRIMCITKDQEGFMWFGTWTGLSRFDGQNFTSFPTKAKDKAALKNNRIDQILDDKSGYLWLKSSDAHIYRFDKKTESFLAFQDLIKDSIKEKVQFNYLIEGGAGELWLMSQSHGLFNVKGNGTAAPRWTQYSATAKGSFRIPSNHIVFFKQDKYRQQWLGTDKGLVLLAPDKQGVYTPVKLPAPPTSGYLVHIAEQNGQIWFTDNTGQLVGYSPTTRQFTAFKQGDTPFRDLYAVPNQPYVYCITAGNILKRFNALTRSTETWQMPGSEQFHSITGDSKGNVWIEPEGNGIIRFDTARRLFNKFQLQSSADFAHTFKGFETFEDKAGRFWAIMKGCGLGYFDQPSQAISYFHNNPADPNRLFPNSVRVVFYDKDGVMWFATVEEGVYRVIFHENNFEQRLLIPTEERPYNEVRGICNDHLNRLWLSTKIGGLHLVKNQEKINVRFENMPDNGLGHVYCILEDRQNNIWLGTKDKGLYKATPKNIDGTLYRLQHFEADASNDSAISSNKVYALLEDAQGRIWAGTLEKGLNQVVQRDDRTVFIHPKNGLANYPPHDFGRIRHLALDGAGRIWLGTTDGLMVMTENGDKPGSYYFKKYSKMADGDSSLSDNDVQFIYKDAKNTMWLATSGGGLNKAIGGNPAERLAFTNYSIKDGLQTDFIVSCMADQQDNLWLATPNGLSRFDGNSFRNYNSYDGLIAKGFSEAAVTRLLNGDLAFGTINGYLIFSPQLVKDHKVKADIAFTRLQVNNTDITIDDSSGILSESINTTRSITLAYDQNILSIDYSILDYRFQDNGVFAYRLKGFDETWHNNKNIPRITYTNLPPGDYVLEVKSLSNDRYSNTPIKQLGITILPPPWKTWWAYLLYFLLLAAIIALAYRIAKTMLQLRQRIAVEKKLTDLKLRFYTNISHELKTPLTLIHGPIEAVLKTEELSADGQAHMEVARKNTSRMARFINQLLELGRVQGGKATLHIALTDTVLLARQVTEYFFDALKEKNMQVSINVTAKKTDAWIDAEKIETVLYNLLANAIKFSPQNGSVTIYFKDAAAPYNLSIEVCDEGPGVDANELENIFQLYYESNQPQQPFLKGTGIGLSLSKEMVELHHGKIYARNNTTKGLTVCIDLQTSKEHYKASEISMIAAPIMDIEQNMQPIKNSTPPNHKSVLNDIAEKQLVLVVEDNSELSHFVAQQLRTVYRVEIANNGREGLEKATTLLPDLIVSDIMMPEMDGIAMLDKLKNNATTSHIPVVLLTARYDVASQLEGLRYGADNYITKPFSTDILKAAISNLLEQRKKLFYRLQEAPQPSQPTIATPEEQPLITAHDESFLNDVINIVTNKLQEPDFEIDDIASSVAMSRSAFYKKFRSLTNMAPVEFLNEMRLKKAKQLFDEGDTNIAGVSISVGFNSSKYFSTSFRKYYQCSPSEYLKKKARKEE